MHPDREDVERLEVSTEHDEDQALLGTRGHADSDHLTAEESSEPEQGDAELLDEG